MSAPTPLSARPGLGEKLAYALGDAGTALAWRPLMTFLPIFYTDTVGLPAAAVGWLLLVTRFSDGVTDVVMGGIADRTRSPWGRFRPWLLWSALPFGLMLALTFTTPGWGATGNLVWAYATYFLLTLAFTANNVPYSSLMGVLTGDVKERTRVSAFRFFGAFAGGGVALGLANWLIATFGQGNDRLGYTYTFILYGALLAGCSLITFAGTRERVQPPAQPVRIADDFRDLVGNRAWWLLLVMGFLWVSYIGMRQGAVEYYFRHYLGRPELSGPFLVMQVVTSCLAAVATPLLAQRVCQRQLFLGALAIAGLGSAATYLAGPGDVALVYALGFVAELGAGALPVLFFAMLGDAADASEYTHRRRATGLIYSSGTFAIKMGSGVAGAVAAFVLSRFHYDGTALAHTAEALQGVRLNMSLVPPVFLVACAGLTLLYPLTRRRMVEIERDLEQRRGAVGPAGVAD